MNQQRAMTRAYARALEEARREFAGALPDVMAQGAGVTYEREVGAAGQGTFEVLLLDVPLTVRFPQGVVTAGREEADVGVVVVVLHHMARSVGVLELAGGVRYAGLPGASAFAAAFRARVEAPLAQRFGRDDEAFLRAVSQLGGREASGVWELPFLPNLPLGARLGLAEGMMPADCVMLFPRRAGFVYAVEDLAVAGQLLAARLLALGGDAGVTGRSPWSLPSLLAWSDVAAGEGA